jgi:hypothetical protein
LTRKLPADAFDAYLALGERRSYSTIAKQYGVSKRCVTKRASQEGWTERLAKIEADARAISDHKATEELAAMRERHLATLKVMGMRVLAALRDCTIKDGMDAIRAADITIKLERLLAGEVSKRTELSVAEVTRHEMRTLLTVVRDDSPRVVEAVVIGAEAEDDDDDDDLSDST